MAAAPAAISDHEARPGATDTARRSITTVAAADRMKAKDGRRTPLAGALPD
jgi:hypothetical protein